MGKSGFRAGWRILTLRNSYDPIYEAGNWGPIAARKRIRSAVFGLAWTDQLRGCVDFFHSWFAGRAARKQVVACRSMFDPLRIRVWPVPGGKYALRFVVSHPVSVADLDDLRSFPTLPVPARGFLPCGRLGGRRGRCGLRIHGQGCLEWRFHLPMRLLSPARQCLLASSGRRQRRRRGG